jgi:transposase
MLALTDQLKIFVYTSPTDLRKGINGLSGLVREELEADPLDGSLFVFINKRRDRLKILHFESGGFWIYYRVLEAGTLETLTNPTSAAAITIDSTELAMLLSGVKLTGAHRRKRFQPPQRSRSA